MYDKTFNNSSPNSTFLSSEYDISRLNVPLAMFNGSKDTLPDHQKLLKKLDIENNPMFENHTLEGYEHLEVLWAKDLKDKLINKLIPIVEKHNK